MSLPTQHAQASVALVSVRTTDDMELLVKESELLTGLPGRTFVISGAERLAYRLQQRSHGFRVQRLDADGRVLHTQDLMVFEFLEHSLVEALQAGQLFAAPLPSTAIH